MKIDQTDIHVILPAFNESMRIQSVIADLRRHGWNRLVVIDDGSSDDTASICRHLKVPVVQHFLNRGAGAAAQTAIELARKKAWPYLVLMDADGQHDAQDIFELKSKMEADQCDIVVGSRFITKQDGMPKSRIFFNGLANNLTNLFCEKNYTDSQSGLRLLNARATHALNLGVDGFGFCSEMLVKAERADLTISETQTRIIYSDYSLSKGQDLQNGIQTALSFLSATIFGQSKVD